MILDTVSVVVRCDLVGEGGTPYWKAEFLTEHVYYGSGAASDAQKAQQAAGELNVKYKTSERYYEALRIDVEDAIAEGLIKI